MILIVEDDYDCRTIMAEVLTSNGYEVQQAPNGAVAMRMLQRESPSLVIMDLMMPIMDGWELCEKILQSKVRQIPIIILSGVGDLNVGLPSSQVVAIMPKPFKWETLLRLVKQYNCH